MGLGLHSGRSLRLAAIESLLDDLFCWNAQRQQNSSDMFHEGLGPTEEERPVSRIVQVFRDELAADTARRTMPSIVGLRQGHNALQVEQPLLQGLQLRGEDNVRAGAYAVKECCLGMQGEIVNIAEHRNHGRDPAACREKDDAGLGVLVEMESAKRT